MWSDWPSCLLGLDALEARPSPLQCFRIYASSAFFSGQFEINQVAAEATRLDGSEGDAYSHPDAANNPGFPAKILPQKKANRETCQRWRPYRQNCQPYARYSQ